MGKKNRKQKELKIRDLEGINNKEEFNKGLIEISKTERGRESILFSYRISSFMRDLIEDYKDNLGCDKFVKFQHRIVEEYNNFRDAIIEIVNRDGGDKRHFDYLTSCKNYGISWRIVYEAEDYAIHDADKYVLPKINVNDFIVDNVKIAIIKPK